MGLTSEQKQRHKEARKRWYNKLETKLHLAKYALERRKKNPELRILDCARYRSKYKGIDFDLTIEDIVIPEVCPILGIPLFLGDKTLKGNSPALDRIDNSKGYIKGNVKVISHKANTHKSNLTIEQVRNLLKYMET